MGLFNREKQTDNSTRLEARFRDYIEVFNSVAGQEVLKDLMLHCNFASSVISDNPHITYFNEGKRDVVLHILSVLRITPSQIKDFIVEDNSSLFDKE